jgi:hypothetical protein
MPEQGRTPLLTCLASAVLLAGIAWATAAPVAHARPDLSAYRGAGTWVDIYDPALLRDPVGAVERMRTRGVKTLYLETANYRQAPSVDIVYSLAVGQFIDAAHVAGIRVVAWYLPSLTNLRLDLRRSLAAIRFTTAAGGRFDSFALDIESGLVRSISRRNRYLLLLSRRIRRAAGSNYPLGAITPDQRSTSTSLPSLWPGFPYRRLRAVYDVFLPMAYSSFRVSGSNYIYRYTRANIDYIRQRTRDYSTNVHVIGGLANSLSAFEVKGMVEAARDGGAIGASLYKFRLSAADDFLALAAFR